MSLAGAAARRPAGGAIPPGGGWRTADRDDPRTRGRRRGTAAGAVVALVGWTVFVAGAAVLLHRVGGVLAPPPLTDPSRFGHWLGQRQPAEATVAVVRLLALGLAWYLVVVTVAGASARAAGAGSLARAADAISLPVVRRLVDAAVGVTVATASLAGAATPAVAGEAVAPPAPPVAAVTMRRLPAPAMPPATPPPAAALDNSGPVGPAEATGPSPLPTMRRMADTPPGPATAGSATTGPGTAAVPVPAPAGHGEEADHPPLRTWRVEPGDHFWAVAERVLAEAWRRAPTDAEVGPYWRAMVEANVAVLRDPGNADLLFPGQVIVVPVPKPAPS